MRGGHLAATALAAMALLAGCMGAGDRQDSPPPGADEPPAAAAGEGEGNGEAANATGLLEPVPGAGLRETRVRLDALRMEYADSLVRVRLRAVGDLHLEVDWRIRAPDQSRDAECLAGAVHAFAPGTGTGPLLLFGAYAAAWSTDSGVFAEAGAAGQEATLVPDQFEADGILPIEGRIEGAGLVPAGGWVDLDLGGSGPEYLRRFGGESNLTVDVRGDVEVLPLPPAPLRCGAGTRELDSAQLVVTGYLGQAAVDGRVGFDTRTGSTALVAGTSSLGPQELVMRFLAAEPEPVDGAYNRTASAAGRIELEFARQAGLQGQPGWLFADVHWPVLRT